MLVLALETVTREGSLGAWIDGDLHARTGDRDTTHGERLPLEVTEFLGSLGRSLSEVDLFAVISGPGSFTGLRVGIAAVQGFALARDRRVVPVPTLEALAAGWLQVESTGGVVVACLDGQRGEVFYAGWRPDQGGTEIAGSPIALPPAVGTPVEAAASLATLAPGEPVVVVGDGGQRYADMFGALPAVRVVAPAEPLARTAARLAATHPERAIVPHALEPVYLRRPDAVLARERAGLAGTRGQGEPFVINRVRSSDDLPAIERLQQETFTNPWSLESIQWELENTETARLYVMRAGNGHVVAFCACWLVHDELHINSLAVGADWRRRGLATRLLRAVFEEARAAGARSATLEVRSSNLPARALYERLQFAVEGTRRDYYQEPREDALVLWNRRLG